MKMNNYEDSVAFLGTSGPFQRRVFFLLCFTAIPSGYNLLTPILLLAVPSHHCHIPARSNLSQEWIEASIPVQEVAGQLEKSSCSRYELDLVQNISALYSLGSGPETLLSNLTQEACNDGWSYSKEHFEATAGTEFNLVCSDQWKQPLSSFFYFLGGLIGCFASGPFSDRFGRKPTMYIAIALLSIFSIALAFAPSWPVFVVLFFLMGMGQISTYIVIFVLGSEILTGQSRILFCNMAMPASYVLGTTLLPCTAYFVKNWRHLSLILSVPGLACIPLWWLIPESPRWLLSRGDLQEAERVLKFAALVNRVEAPHVIFPSANVEKTESAKTESGSFLSLLKTSNIRNISLILWVIWFFIHVCYFGLSFNMSGLSGNPFLNYILVSVVDIPGYAAGWLAARFLPRRWSFISLGLLGSLVLLCIQLTVDSHPAITLTLVLVGKFAILAAVSVFYVFTSEMFPTFIRNTAMATCAMFSRVGSSVSPYLQQLAQHYDFQSWTLVGALTLLSALVCVLLPETFKKPLPDSIEQMGQIQRLRLSCTYKHPPQDPPDDGKSTKEIAAPEIICATQL